MNIYNNKKLEIKLFKKDNKRKIIIKTQLILKII